MLDTRSSDAAFLLHRVRVVRRRSLSVGFVRLTSTGPALDRFAEPGLDQRTMRYWRAGRSEGD